MNLTNIKKFLGAATGAVAIAVADGLLSGDAQKWTVGALAAATAFVVYLLPNSGQPNA